jgi:hypothetical protein
MSNKIIFKNIKKKEKRKNLLDILLIEKITKF